jgi:thiol:disulfide interchange protein
LLPAKQKSPEPGREVPLPQGFPLLDDVVAKAKQEQKLVVLDVSAKWCVPCWKMKRTFYRREGEGVTRPHSMDQDRY